MSHYMSSNGAAFSKEYKLKEFMKYLFGATLRCSCSVTGVTVENREKIWLGDTSFSRNFLLATY